MKTQRKITFGQKVVNELTKAVDKVAPEGTTITFGNTTIGTPKAEPPPPPPPDFSLAAQNFQGFVASQWPVYAPTGRLDEPGLHDLTTAFFSQQFPNTPPPDENFTGWYHDDFAAIVTKPGELFDFEPEDVEDKRFVAVADGFLTRYQTVLNDNKNVAANRLREQDPLLYEKSRVLRDATAAMTKIFELPIDVSERSQQANALLQSTNEQTAALDRQIQVNESNKQQQYKTADLAYQEFSAPLDPGKRQPGSTLRIAQVQRQRSESPDKRWTGDDVPPQNRGTLPGASNSAPLEKSVVSPVPVETSTSPPGTSGPNPGFEGSSVDPLPDVNDAEPSGIAAILGDAGIETIADLGTSSAPVALDMQSADASADEPSGITALLPDVLDEGDTAPVALALPDDASAGFGFGLFGDFMGLSDDPAEVAAQTEADAPLLDDCFECCDESPFLDEPALMEEAFC